MPLMQGKSDKPQKQALAIAYAIKRRASKKMAQGGQVQAPPPPPKEDHTNPSLGQVLDSESQKKVAQSMKSAFGMAKGGEVPKEDMSRGHDPMHGEETDESEDTHPMMEPEHSAEDMVYEEYELPLHEQAHGQLPQPKEPREYLAKGGEIGNSMHMGMHPHTIAKSIMMKRMAKGGSVESENWMDRPEDGDSIDNFHSESHPDNDFLSDEEDTEYFNPNQADLREPDAKEHRKSMLSGIMRNLQKRHYGT